MNEVRRWLLTVTVGALIAIPSSWADIDRSIVDFVVPADIKWVRNEAGTNETAMLYGDPSKPGPYVMRIKWLPGNMSRPHVHNTDRFFVVISGTWWVGSGNTFDPDSTVAVPPGSYVIHRAGGAHYDGAKDGETIIQVWGTGPLQTKSVERPR